MEISVDDFVYTYNSQRRLKLACLIAIVVVSLGLVVQDLKIIPTLGDMKVMTKILLGVLLLCTALLVNFRKFTRNQLGEKLARFVYREQVSKEEVLKCIHNKKKLKMSFESYLALMNSGKLSIDVKKK